MRDVEVIATLRGRRDNLRLRMAATAILDTSGFLQN